MKYVLVALAIVLLVGTLIAALRSVWFLRKFDENNRHAYLALVLLAAGILVAVFVPERIEELAIGDWKIKFARLEKEVTTLASQTEAFFKQKQRERFDGRTSDRMQRINTRKYPNSVGIWIYTIQVTLKLEPIPESVEVWHNDSPLDDPKVDGKVLTFQIVTGETWGRDFRVRVTYYPRAVLAPTAK